MEALQPGRYAAEPNEGDPHRTSNYVQSRHGPATTLRRGPRRGKGFAIDVWRIRSLALAVAALGGLIAAAPLVGAQRSTPDTSPHLLLVPDTARADAALDAASVRTVADYRSFTLVEARGEDDTALRAAGADRRDDMRTISLPGADVDPLRSGESLARKGASDPDEVLAVVQFVGPVKDAWLERLRDSGARIVQYVSQNGYLVHATGRQVDLLAALVGTGPGGPRGHTRHRPGQTERAPAPSERPATRRGADAAGADGRDAAAVARDGPRARGDSSIGGSPRSSSHRAAPRSTPTPPSLRWWRSRPTRCLSFSTSAALRSSPAISPLREIRRDRADTCRGSKGRVWRPGLESRST